LVEVQYPRQRAKEVCINPKCITWTPEYQKKEEEKKKKEKELESSEQ
jgi:hypothetical protein